MTWMSGSIGKILAVGLLGYTRIGQMAPANGTVSLNWTYGQDGRSRTGGDAEQQASGSLAG
jgi:hypothetical protein